MESAAETSHEKEAPEYYENSIWPALVAFATGLAAVGFFFLMKRMILVAGFLAVLASAVIIAGFFYSDTRNWTSAISKLGKIPRDSLVGSFPVDINLTIQIIIMTELLLFGGAFAMYFAIREQFVLWPPPGTPILDDFIARVQTLILISSSILVEWAIWQLKQGKMKAFKAGLIGTTILGAGFSCRPAAFLPPACNGIALRLLRDC